MLHDKAASALYLRAQPSRISRIERDVLHKGSYWQSGRQDAGQSALCAARWLIRCVKDRPQLLLLLVWLMRCHCPAGWAGPDRRRWCSTFPKPSLCDFAWLMDCDDAQLQGWLCHFFLFFSWGESVWSEVKKKSVKHCWTRLMALNLHISRLGCTPGARSGERLKDLHCQQVKDSACTTNFCFSTKRNLISLSQLIMSLSGETWQSVDSEKFTKDQHALNASQLSVIFQLNSIIKVEGWYFFLCFTQSCKCRSPILQE